MRARRGLAGMAGLDPAIDATLRDANGEDLPAAVLHQRLAPRVPRRVIGRSGTGGASRLEGSAKNTAGRLWRTLRLGATERRRA
jgi:hypothetical protein